MHAFDGAGVFWLFPIIGIPAGFALMGAGFLLVALFARLLRW